MMTKQFRSQHDHACSLSCQQLQVLQQYGSSAQVSRGDVNQPNPGMYFVSDTQTQLRRTYV